MRIWPVQNYGGQSMSSFSQTSSRPIRGSTVNGKTGFHGQDKRNLAPFELHEEGVGYYEWSKHTVGITSFESLTLSKFANCDLIPYFYYANLASILMGGTLLSLFVNCGKNLKSS